MSKLFWLKPDKNARRGSRPIRLVDIDLQLGRVVGTARMFALDDVRHVFRALIKLEIQVPQLAFYVCIKVNLEPNKIVFISIFVIYAYITEITEVRLLVLCGRSSGGECVMSSLASGWLLVSSKMTPASRLNMH